MLLLLSPRGLLQTARNQLVSYCLELIDLKDIIDGNKEWRPSLTENDVYDSGSMLHQVN